MYIRLVSLFIFSVLMISNTFGETWSYRQRVFIAEDALYQMSPALLNFSARKIADHIEFLKQNHLPEIENDFVITFAPSGSADALFYPPLSYRDSEGKLVSSAVIVINPRVLSDNRLYRLIGHELFHYIHDKKAPYELSWIREGLAQNFEHDVYGGISQSHLRAALSDSRHALEENFDIENISSERYGNSFLFFHFLEQNCLVNQAWQEALEVASPDKFGRRTLESILTRSVVTSSLCASVVNLMGHFTIQKLINSQTQDHPMALWPLLEASQPMDSEGYVLGHLSEANLRKFLELLPPFLGFKISINIWFPQTTQFPDIEFWYWSESGQMLLPWFQRPLVLADDAQVLFFKKR